MRQLRTAIVLVLGLLATVLSAPAPAAPTWLPVAPLSVSGGSDQAARVAVDDAGNATAVWHDNLAVLWSFHPAGGTWSPHAPLSAPGVDSLFPEIVVTPAGAATVVWTKDDPSGLVLQFATRQGGGAWSAPADVFGSVRVAGEFAVATDPAGTVTVVYLHPTGGSSSTVEVTTRPAGGAWSDPVELAAAGFHEQPVVVADASGRVTAAWGAIGAVQSRQRPAGGSWSATAPVGDGLWPDLGVDAAGNVTATWQGPGGAMQASSMPPGGTWSPAQPLSGASPDAGTPHVTVAASGAAMVTWSSFESGTTYVPRAAYRPPGGAFGPGVALRTSDKGAVAPDVAVAGGGFVAVWDEGNMIDGYTAFGARFTGAWSPAAPLLPHPGFEARVAGAPNGDAVAVLAGFPEAGRTIEAVALDVGGPTLTTFSAPGAGPEDQILSYSATAADAWSAVASYSWSFGDGTTATGPSVTHAYADPGTYAVTLTVADAVGNTTTRSSPTAVALTAPGWTTFKLSKKKIATDQKTKLKVGLTKAATVKVVLKSKHKHLVNGKKKYLKVVIRKRLPAGLSKVTVQGKKLVPDTWKVTGTATNSAGKSAKKKTRLVVVEP